MPPGSESRPGSDAVLAGRITLSQLAALVADASLIVCGDTGIAHLATAYGTPSVVLFSNGDRRLNELPSEKY